MLMNMWRWWSWLRWRWPYSLSVPSSPYFCLKVHIHKYIPIQFFLSQFTNIMQIFFEKKLSLINRSQAKSSHSHTIVVPPFLRNFLMKISCCKIIQAYCFTSKHLIFKQQLYTLLIGSILSYNCLVKLLVIINTWPSSPL